jgi:hypothetical protein
VAKRKKVQVQATAKEIPLVWVGLEEIPVRTVTSVVSQIADDQFFVSFGCINHPILVGSQAAVRARLDSIESVSITPVARIAMTEEKMEQVIKALQSNLRKHRAAKKAEAK